MSLAQIVQRQQENAFNPLAAALAVAVQKRKMDQEDEDRLLREDVLRQRKEEWRAQQEMGMQKYELDKQAARDAHAKAVIERRQNLGEAYMNAFDIVENGEDISAHQPPGGWSQFQADNGVTPDMPEFSPNPPIGAGMLLGRVMKIRKERAELKAIEALAQQRMTPPKPIKQVDENGRVWLIDPASGEASPVEGPTAHTPQGPTPRFSFVQGADAQGSPVFLRGNNMTGSLEPTGQGLTPKTTPAKQDAQARKEWGEHLKTAQKEMEDYKKRNREAAKSEDWTSGNKALDAYVRGTADGEDYKIARARRHQYNADQVGQKNPEQAPVQRRLKDGTVGMFVQVGPSQWRRVG